MLQLSVISILLFVNAIFSSYGQDLNVHTPFHLAYIRRVWMLVSLHFID